MNNILACKNKFFKIAEDEMRFNVELNFLCLVKDEFHTPTMSARTASKYFCFGGGEILRKFFYEGIKFDMKNFFLCDKNEKRLNEDRETLSNLSN